MIHTDTNHQLPLNLHIQVYDIPDGLNPEVNLDASVFLNSKLAYSLERHCTDSLIKVDKQELHFMRPQTRTGLQILTMFLEIQTVIVSRNVLLLSIIIILET